MVVDEAGRPVAGAEVRADAFTDREARGVTGPDGSFAIRSDRPTIDGTSLLARSADGDRLGVFRYGFNLKGAEAEAPARIVLKPAREVIVRVVDASKAPSPARRSRRRELPGLADATTGPDGSARLRVPADAKVEWVVALKSGRGFDYAEYGPIDRTARRSTAVPAGELPASVALTLDGARTARIKAVDGAGKPLAGVGFAPWLLHKEGRRSQVNLSSRGSSPRRPTPTASPPSTGSRRRRAPPVLAARRGLRPPPGRHGGGRDRAGHRHG